ncbi:RPS6, partial [Symbiodinium microadriaticum]
CHGCLPGLRPLDDGSCGPCGGTSYLVFAIAVVLLVLGVAVVYVVLVMDAEQVTQPGHTLVGAVAASQLLTLVQQLVVIRKLGIEWQEPLKEYLELLAVFGVDLDMLSLSCIASVSPVLKYVLAVSVTPILAAIALLLHLSALFFKKYVKQGLRVRLDLSALLRTVGSLIAILFISIFTSLVAPFQCNLHPNGRMTVQEYGSVFCTLENEHLQMSLIGAAACLMPLCFLSICFWIIFLKLPRWLRRADAVYFRACSFLWMRYRPGAERFSIFFLCRNALFVLCPLLPSLSIKLVVLNVLLYSSLIATTLSQPWRVPASNALDVLLHVGLLVVLYMASMFAGQEVGTTGLIMATMISLVFILMMVAAIVATMLYGLGLYILRQRRKPWRFFLSHHKRAAGSFARLLKIQLQQSGYGFSVFLDTDNLRDLTELFGFVRDTETCVVLASPGILARKWCVGEIVTAKLHKVHTVMVRWPNFADPTAMMYEKLEFAIPGIEALTAYSISIDEVCKTLRWLRTLECIAFPHSLNLESIGRVCDALTGTVRPCLERTARPDCIILVDPANQEAVATAHVLFELLKLSNQVRMSPSVLEAGDDIPSNISKALLVCSSGCFHSEALASWLIRLFSAPQPAILPIIADPDFVVPVVPFENAVAGVAGSFTEAEMASYAQAVESIFQEIASVLAPQSYSSTQ